MKRFILGAMLLTSTCAFSQDYLYNNPDNKAYFGANIGVDITSTSGQASDTYNNGAGFSLGGFYNIPLWQNLYFEPGIALFYDTFGEDIIIADSEALPLQADRSIRNFGFRIPMVVGYHFDFTDMARIAPFTGFQINLNLYAHDSYKNMPAGAQTEGVSLFGEHGFKHVDLQWVFGASVTYDRYVVTFKGGIGMTKVSTLTFDSFRRNTCTISVGYNF